MRKLNFLKLSQSISLARNYNNS